MGIDLLVRGGTVVDGSGARPFLADVAVERGRIAALGEMKCGDDVPVLEAGGLLVAPGFIDIHSHSDPHPDYRPPRRELDYPGRNPGGGGQLRPRLRTHRRRGVGAVQHLRVQAGARSRLEDHGRLP